MWPLVSLRARRRSSACHCKFVPRFRSRKWKPCGWNDVPMYLWFLLNAKCFLKFETKGPEKCLVRYQVWCESCTFIATDFRNDEIILFCAEMLEKSKIKVSKAWIHADRRNYFRCKAGLHIQALAELRSGLLQKRQGRKLLKQLLGWWALVNLKSILHRLHKCQIATIQKCFTEKTSWMHYNDRMWLWFLSRWGNACLCMESNPSGHHDMNIHIPMELLVPAAQCWIFEVNEGFGREARHPGTAGWLQWYQDSFVFDEGWLLHLLSQSSISLL